ncbi:MAG TPA: transketolase [Gemmatimonadales bacterium]|nr:transketolase [Gemmatimonadales bacterium]
MSESDSAWIAINAIRALAMDAVEQAQAGHPGTPMALAPAAYVLWTRFLKHDPRNPAWPDRDRFILSCGHASMLQYALLHLSGYDLTLDDIRHFRQWGSRTAGHPERGHTPGIETTTGPLGQGVGNAVGMAIAERLLAEQFNRPGLDIVDHRVWAFVSDGDVMEGVASEAASLAGHLRLDKLTLIYDDNHITIDGSTSLTFSEDVGRRFEAYGWHVERVGGEGNDLDAIAAGLDAACREGGRPSLVILRTHIADPAPTKRDSAEAHGAPLGADEVRRTKEIMGWPTEPPFYVPDAAYDAWRPAAEAGAKSEAAWRERLARYRTEHAPESAEFTRRVAGELPPGWEAALPAIPAGKGLATRQASAQVLTALAGVLPELAGGSADLAGSTGTQLKQVGTLGPASTGREIHWGVREHGMAAALNGMAAHGAVRPFGSTFLIFTDYMKPAIRLAALMKLPVIYVGTHDSIGLGEDGPTHQPVEQLAMLRAIPGMLVLRPADATETVEAWRAAIRHRTGPVVLVLTRQKLPVLDRAKLASADGVARGGYVLWDPPGSPEAILIGTGSEVHVALAAAERLLADGIRARVVSLPSWELFEAQQPAYRESVLPPAIRARVGIEAASPLGWLRYVTEDGVMIAMESFGASAPAERLFSEFGFTTERACAAVRGVLGRITP